MAETLELRGTLGTLLSLSNLGADLLYAFNLSRGRRVRGGGVDFACIFIPGLAAGSTLARHSAGPSPAASDPLPSYNRRRTLSTTSPSLGSGCGATSDLA